MLGVLWFVQRRFARGAARRRDGQAVEVVARQAIGQKAQVVVVQTADARYVLGVTEHGVSVIDKLVSPEPEPEPEAEPAAPRDDKSDADAFERILAGEMPEFDALAGDAPARTRPSEASVPRLRVRERRDPLRGSILSPETWRQTSAALRRSR